MKRDFKERGAVSWGINMTHLRMAAFGTAVGSAVALMSLPADQARAQITAVKSLS